jgi:cysteinyl-tRNA synthetase
MLKVYNTLTKEIQEFQPMAKGQVKMYSCGPTVYDYVHIGNIRAYIFVDLLKRYLTFSGYAVKHVMNITDVDDKTIKRSQIQGKSLKEFTEFYYKEFLKNIESVNIIPAEIMPKATDHIQEMVEMIENLKEKGLAYEKDGSTYYPIGKFENYGKLAGIEKVDVEDMQTEKSDEYSKEDVRDFALWKAYDTIDGDVFWETALGKGRPGWHIECSAMSTKYLGNSFDIHCGGVDLIFPHHTNEIAQTEGATGQSFVKYWLHNEHLLVEGEKMSKSLNNFITLQQLIDEGVNPLLLRILFLKTHYRQKSNFTRNGLLEVKSIVERIVRTIRALEKADAVQETINVDEILKPNEETFRNALDNDLNISEGFATLFQIIDFIEKNSYALTREDGKKLREYLCKLDNVLGFIQKLYFQYQEKLNAVYANKEIMTLVGNREKVRNEKNFAESDNIRNVLFAKGISLKDTPNGVILDLVNIF